MSKKILQAAAGAGGESIYVEDVFSTYVYEGTGSALDITNNIDLDGEGGIVWIKNRHNTSNHALFDTERGAEKLLFTDDTAAEQDRTADNDSLGAFNSDGFSLQASSGNRTNESGSDFVSWSFRKQAGFCDVVTWTGDGTSNRQITHNLGSVPGCIIVKRLNSTANWAVWHRGFNSASTNGGAFLNLSNAFGNEALFSNNSSAFSDSYFLVSSSANRETNGYLDTYVAYVFAHDDQSFGDNSDESIIKCGSYTGDGGAGTTEVNLGFEPQWILVKATSAADNWFIIDNMRGWATESNTSNDAYLLPNASNAESTGGFLDITATGFKTTLFSNVNVSGRTYAYVAIRRPMKTPEAGTEVFKPNDVDNGASQPDSLSDFPVDMYFRRYVNTTNDTYLLTRLISPNALKTNGSDAESAFSTASAGFDYNDGVMNIFSSDNSDFHTWMFKRATGFFDVCCYDGNEVAGTSHNHNLGVTPEMMIVKSRSDGYDWIVWVNGFAITDVMQFNSNSAKFTNDMFDTLPTSSVFYVANNVQTNRAGSTYIAYLFATVEGVSKVGSYSGTGSNINVDCGFSAGARFVLIKRTDSSGDWYLYDSKRGIVAGNDPYILSNSTAAEVTNTDYIDPLNAGFTVTSSAPAALNNSGGTYIFLAIAQVTYGIQSTFKR